ncbi:hypothetical protein ACFX14_033376 [Malus domestica]
MESTISLEILLLQTWYYIVVFQSRSFLWMQQEQFLNMRLLSKHLNRNRRNMKHNIASSPQKWNFPCGILLWLV